MIVISPPEFYRPILPWTKYSDDPAVEQHYQKCRLNGCSHEFADMLCSRRAPAADTETSWIAGMKPQFTDEKDAYSQYVMKRAKAAGVNTKRAYYSSQLATSIGDPNAWVSSKDDVKRQAARLGCEVTGSVNFTPIQDAPKHEWPKQYTVAEDIVETEFAKLPVEAQKEKNAKDDLREKLSGR